MNQYRWEKMAARKKARKTMAKKAGGWGGRRPGAGRPKGSGQGPSPNSRRNRVAVMFTDTELKTLNGIARKKRVPVATAAYELISRGLKRS
jgi:DNA invertase Pin-like site-specific DNA recombinase